MINPEDRALQSLHRVLVLARKMGYDKEDPSHIASVLDVAEYLVVLIADKLDRTDDFRRQLQALADARPHFAYALRTFDEG